MTPFEANCLAALLHHLDGTQVLDPTDLMTDVEYLAKTSSGPVHFNEETLLETLTEVAQRFADGGQP